MTDQEKLNALADTLDKGPRPLSAAISDQIVHRAQASMADVYAHALGTIQTLREKLDQVEDSIKVKRQDAEQSIVRFVNLVNDSLDAMREIDLAITRVGDQL